MHQQIKTLCAMLVIPNFSKPLHGCLSRKQAAIKEALQHSWKGYVDYAWGMDELTPLTKAGKQSFGGLGATMVDTLDTLWLMGLTQEFQAARNWVVNELNFNRCALCIERFAALASGCRASRGMGRQQARLEEMVNLKRRACRV